MCVCNCGPDIGRVCLSVSVLMRVGGWVSVYIYVSVNTREHKWTSSVYIRREGSVLVWDIWGGLWGPPRYQFYQSTWRASHKHTSTYGKTYTHAHVYTQASVFPVTCIPELSRMTLQWHLIGAPTMTLYHLVPSHRHLPAMALTGLAVGNLSGGPEMSHLSIGEAYCFRGLPLSCTGQSCIGGHKTIRGHLWKVYTA